MEQSCAHKSVTFLKKHGTLRNLFSPDIYKVIFIDRFLGTKCIVFNKISDNVLH